MLFLYFKSFARSKRALFSVFMLLQFIALVSLFYAWFSFQRGATNYAIYAENASTFTVDFEATEYRVVFPRIENIVSEEKENLAAVVFGFDSGETRAYLFGQNMTVNYGRNFESNDEAIVGTDAKLSLGQSYTSDAGTYLIVGIRSSVAYTEIPIESVPNETAVSSVDILLSSLPNRADVEGFREKLAVAFPNATITSPPPRSNAAELTYSSELLQTLGVLTLAVLDLTFLFRYVILKRETLIKVSRLCGATKFDVVFGAVAEYAVYSAVVMCASVIFTAFVLRPVLFGKVSFVLKDYLTPVVVFAGLCLIMTLPLLLHINRAPLLFRRKDV